MKLLAVLSLLCLSLLAHAVDLSSPELEIRFNALAEELRCAVCQNQNLAGSNAELAKDLRGLIVEMLEQGKSDQEILDFMVARYGKFVLYRPPVDKNTVILWLAPLLMFLGAIFFIIRLLRKRQTEISEAIVSDTEQAQIQTLLKDNEGGPSS